VQKAGTTSLDDWLSQHPQIYCYESLKDVHLFAKFKSDLELEQRLSQEPVKYKGELIVLQSAVNYIFYPHFLESISRYNAHARLIVILRNPIDRALSAYDYFKKMFRESRSLEEALLYEPRKSLVFSKDNNDFTYIEHGLYYQQVQQCLKYFSREQLLILDYGQLKKDPEQLLTEVFSFLNIDTSFKVDLRLKNVTGEIRSQAFQKSIINESKVKKWVIKNLIDFWFPVTKRKLLKQKLFELNTGKKKLVEDSQENEDIKIRVTNHLYKCFINDTRQLDALLGTDFEEKWFVNNYAKASITTVD
jgi:hypothetical protein